MTKKILLVDDRENIRITLRDVFEALGYTVAVASTGEEALEIIDNIKPDLALMDIELNTVIPSSMVGFEVCRQIKQIKKLSTKVIIYTGTLRTVDTVMARRMGADDFIIKGKDTAILVKAVEELIGGARNE